MEPATYVVDAVARLQRAVFAIGSQRLQPWNMTLSSYTALRVMANRPELTLAQLARRCFVKPQTMTRIVSELERRGLVQRLPRPESERALSLSLTDRGHTSLAAMNTEVNKINQTITGVLSPEQVDQLDSLLRLCALTVETELKER